MNNLKSSAKTKKTARKGSAPAPEAALSEVGVGATESVGERVVLVVGPAPECAETIAQGFATQGETMRVVWFELARQALAAGLQKALAGVIVCHRTEVAPENELATLRHALPDTPVLAWQLA
jgi:hypothetical protein